MIQQPESSTVDRLSGEQSELSDQRITQILFSSFQKLAKVSPSNAELSKAHQQIADCMKQQSFMDILISLLIKHQDDIKYANFVKQILTTFTTYIRHQQSRSALVRKINPHDLNKKLIQIFTNQVISDSNKRMLLKTYPQFIFANGMETIRTQTIDHFCQIFGVITMNISNAYKEEDFLEGIMFRYVNLYVPLAHTIIKGPLEQTLMKKIFKAFAKPTLYASFKLIESVERAISSQNEQFFIQITYWAERSIQFLRDLTLLTSKDYMYYQRGDLLKQSLFGQLILRCFCLSLKPKTQNQPLPELIIPANGIKYLDRLNQIKKHCMDMINFFSKLIVSNQESKKQLERQQYLIPFEIIRFVLDRMVLMFVREFQALEYPKNELPHKGFYKSFIEALSKIIKILRFYNESEKHRNVLIFNICLPLLQRIEGEHIASAADFKGKRQDILNMHSMDIIQNSVCKLIQSYIDKVDGSVHLFSNQIVSMIIFHLTANPNAFNKLPEELVETYFFKNVGYEIQIECGLTILALLSYIAPGRDDLVFLIEDLLQSKRQFFFKQSNSGALKSAVLLCYTYYVDNFYLALSEGKSENREFHLQILQTCCVFIKEYTGIENKSVVAKEELLSLEISALQALDCLQNCVTQLNFLPALFWTGNSWTTEVSEQLFLNIFRFLIFELQYEMNINIMDLLQQFYTESIKTQCKKGFALKRFHYEYKGVPLIIREDLSTLIGLELYKVYNKKGLPNQGLMNAKIMNLLELILTCCQNPDVFLSKEFFRLPTEEEGRWDRVPAIDIYLRRMIQIKKEGRNVNYQIFEAILAFCNDNLQNIIKEGDFKQFFGIFVNLIVLYQPIVDKLIQPLGEMLVKLLSEDAESSHFDQQLNELIEKCSYILMIAIYTRFTPENAQLWGELASLIQTDLSQRSSRGQIIFSSSSYYIGKLLSICLVFMYHMRHKNLDQSKIGFLWRNTIKSFDVYKSLSQKLIVAMTLIRLLQEKQTIPETDEQCLNCFNMVINLLYSSSSKFMEVEKNGNDSDMDKSFSDSSEGDLKEGLNYQQYRVPSNEYVEKDAKENYIVALKNLCHKLKEKSPQFLRVAVESFSTPIQVFVKQKVFYFEGNLTEQGLRKVIKVKK